MRKQMSELQPGEIFLDSFGLPLKVEKVDPLSGGVNQRVRVHFETTSGNRMFQIFKADRQVTTVEICSWGELRS